MRAAVRARIGIAAGLGLGALLLIYGVSRLAGEAQPAPPAPAAQAVSHILVAARPIARGQTLSAGDLSTLAVQGEQPVGAVISQADAVGRVAVVDLAERQILTTTALSSNAADAGLSLMVKPGFRAITLDANDEIAVGSFLRPGDRVDVEVVTPPRTGSGLGEARSWLQNVEVLAIGGALAPGQDASAQGPVAARTVTLAMTPAQVSRFVLGRSAGRFYLVLRNPGDAAQPAPITRVAARGARPVPPAAIEVVSGGRRQVLYPGAGGQ